MKFGAVATREALGAILAHSVRTGSASLGKSRRITEEDIAALIEAGVEKIVVARLEPDDVDENEAARMVAAALASANVEIKPPATGRVNIHARRAGLLRVDRALVDAVNLADPEITLATLEDFATVEASRMVATVKIIPFAVHRSKVEAAIDALGGRLAFRLHPFSARKVALIQTALPGTKPAVLDKTAKLAAIRLARSGSAIVTEMRPPHEEAALASAFRQVDPQADFIIAFGASAVSDDKDVIPAALRAAGGKVERVGMPVDPGNLLVVGSLAGKPVIGAPGCARSPKLNGFDWVLDRLMADIPVTSRDIAGLGVGGLLMEIPTRPQPREPLPPRKRHSLQAVVLAAGRSSRMGESNKLLAEFDGVPLVRRTVERVLAAGLDGVTVVVGHQGDKVRRALEGLPVEIVENPDFATGLASSLKIGLKALPAGVDGAMIVLADMPEVMPEGFRRLADAFRHSGVIVRATHAGKRGNPVVLPRALFAEIELLDGDTGARQVVETSEMPTVDVELGAAASLDVDTPEAMRQAGGTLAG